MRTFLFLVALACTSAASTGCAFIHHLDDYTTADPKADEPGSTGGPDAPSGGGDGGGGVVGPACRTNADCVTMKTFGRSLGGVASGTPVPGVCVASTGHCAELLSAECPRVYGDPSNDDAILVGTILRGNDDSLEKAAALAAEEIDANASGAGLPPKAPGGAPRPIVLVACDAGPSARAAARHLAGDLHVSAIVGPLSGEDVIDVTQQVTVKDDTLVITPTSLASAISELADSDLTWRTIPSDDQRAKLVIEQMNELENVLRTTRGTTTVKLGIVHRTDTLGTSVTDSIRGKLIINGKFITDAANAANVSIDPYEVGNTSLESAIATKYATTFKPDIVFVTAPELVDDLVVPLESALTASRAIYHPYYVFTDASKGKALLDAVGAGKLPVDIKRRVRGIGVKPDAPSTPVLEAFAAAYAARYGAPPATSSAAAAYDATYAVAYAIAAERDATISGAAVAHGLRLLGVGDAASVGAADARRTMQSLSNGKSISLRGTFGSLRWDSNGDIAGGTIEVWCVGGGSGAPAFGSSGVTMDVQTQVVGGAFVQCQ